MQVKDALAALTKKIPGIESLEHGVHDSPEGKNLGFTQVHQFTFQNAAARDAYLTHPARVEFGEFLKRTGILQDALVLDYRVALVLDNPPRPYALTLASRRCSGNVERRIGSHPTLSRPHDA
jgi:hypothetical protein